MRSESFVQKNRKQEQRASQIRRRGLCIAAVFIIIIAIHVLYLFQMKGKFYHGSTLNGYDIAGMTVDEVTELFADADDSTFVKLWEAGRIEMMVTLADMGYSVDALREYGDYGVNPIRVLVSSVPLVLAFISRETLKEQDDKLINICVNMSVITTGVMLLAAVTSGITVGRMGIYTSLYNLILLPHVIESYFTENNIKVVKITAVILYFIYFCIERGF